MDSAINIVENLIKEGRLFDSSNFCYRSGGFSNQYCGEDKPEWLAWKTRTLNAVKEFSSGISPAFKLATEGVSIITCGNEVTKFERAKSTLLTALDILLSALQNDSYGELRKHDSKNINPTLSTRIFVVHGRDSTLKVDVERFLYSIGLVPVVLHRETDGGLTIIEKFEKHSDVGYAFILLTPDDIAYPSCQDSFIDDKRDKEYRSRQNVVFEFGYFVGRLGRSRVCCLYKGNVTMPSDLSGLVYKNIIGDTVDSQAANIMRELTSAGYKLTSGFYFG